MNRRDVLKTLGLTALTATARFGALPLYAQSAPGYKALVAIDLAGGNDGNSLLIPMDSAPLSLYLQGRGSLALAPKSLLQIGAGASAFGLHPALTQLRTVYNARRLAFAANVGNLLQPTTKQMIVANTSNLPEGLFGHDSQANEFSSASGLASTNVGWGGAIADQLSSSGGNLPTLLGVAGASVFSKGITDSALLLSQPTVDGYLGYDNSPASQARYAAFRAIGSSKPTSKLAEASAAIRSQSLVQTATLRSALQIAPTIQTVFPKTTLGAQLAFVAKIISVRGALGATRQVFSCRLGGFDMHSNVLATSAALFADLAASLGAFDSAMQELGTGREVTTFTLSEFSRTLQPNTSSGVDHAWGSNHIVMGGAVAGGQIFGRYPSLALGGADDFGQSGQWIPTTATAQYGAGLAQWFGLSDAALAQVFPLLTRFPDGSLRMFAS